MAREFKLPGLGENVKSADVVNVLVSEGDVIEADQEVVEVETDKATVAVPCPHAGKVTKIHAKAGDTIDVGQVLLTLEETGGETKQKATETPPAAGKAGEKKPAAVKVEKSESPSETSKQPDNGQKPAEKKAVVPPRPQPSQAAGDEKPEPESASTDGRLVPAGPAVRRMARELGVDLARVRGTGEGGRITREDVMTAVRHDKSTVSAPGKVKATQIPATGPVTPPGEQGQDAWGPIHRDKLSKIRKTIAARMVESATSAVQLTNFDDADITELENLRQQVKQDFEAAGIKLTTLAFVIKAVATCLHQHPALNASLDMDAGEAIYKDYVNIGLAVDSDRGLVVPVLRSPDQLSINQIARGIINLSELVRLKKFEVDDLRGSTFTISNMGAIGGTYSTPVLNYPEVAMLLVGRSRKMPMVIDDRIEPRLMMPLSLTYDHRLVDGAVAARFLNDIKAMLEAPARLMLSPQ